MNVRIYKCYDNDLKMNLKSLVIEVMNSFIDNKKLFNNIDIMIKFDDDETYKEKAWGLCYWVDRNHFPRKFKILLSSKQPRKHLLKVLIHELVHVKQYIYGDLKDFVFGKVKWKKRFYHEHDDITNSTDAPWEKEAYYLSEKIYNKLYTN